MFSVYKVGFENPITGFFANRDDALLYIRILEDNDKSENCFVENSYYVS